MKPLFTLLLLTISAGLFAQQKAIDTVVLRPDSTFESLFHRKLYNNRTNVIYHLEEMGNVRDVRVYFAWLEEMNTGNKMYAVRIDQRMNRNIFTDAPMGNAEYIDEDELDAFIGYLSKVRNEIIKTDQNANRYTEYRFYTRAGIMLECYTGVNRWRCVIHYEIGKLVSDTYINNPERMEDLIDLLTQASRRIKEERVKK
jgi:hypothetical protein